LVVLSQPFLELLEVWVKPPIVILVAEEEVVEVRMVMEMLEELQRVVPEVLVQVPSMPEYLELAAEMAEMVLMGL
jgi:hypothetical protein